MSVAAAMVIQRLFFMDPKLEGDITEVGETWSEGREERSDDLMLLQHNN